MTDRRLRSLSKTEMLNIMYQQEKEIERLTAENQGLSERCLSLERTGPLAEASLAVSGIIQATQNAADEYLENLHTINEDSTESGLQTSTIDIEVIAQLKHNFSDMLNLFHWHINRLKTVQTNFEKIMIKRNLLTTSH